MLRPPILLFSRILAGRESQNKCNRNSNQDYSEFVVVKVDPQVSRHAGHLSRKIDCPTPSKRFLSPKRKSADKQKPEQGHSAPSFCMFANLEETVFENVQTSALRLKECVERRSSFQCRKTSRSALVLNMETSAHHLPKSAELNKEREGALSATMTTVTPLVVCPSPS